MAIKDCWFFNGTRARKKFGWIRKTEAGKMMDEIDDIFQPLADDIQSWKKIQDIGKFSDGTMKELQEVWAVLPDPTKKVLKQALNKLQGVISPAILVKIVEMYLKSLAI